MLDRTKPVQTRDGRKVTIYAWDAGGDEPIHGRIEGENGPTSWYADGSYFNEINLSDDCDLINTPQTTTRRLKATPSNGFMLCEATDDANLILQFEDGVLTRAEVVND